MSAYTVTRFPGGTVQHNCNTCRCSVNPRTHVPGSEDCLEGARLRTESRSEW